MINFFREEIIIMNWKDVAIRINKELVKFRRCDMRCSHILVGRKEYEEFRKLDAADEEFADATGWSVGIIRVDEDSYLAGAYMVDEEKEQAKRFKEITEDRTW
jgi:hypothetical protein